MTNNPNISKTLEYITFNSTQDAIRLAQEYNLHPATYQEVYDALKAIFKKFPQDTYHQLALMHPDRQMIIDSITVKETPVTTTVSKVEKTSGADGAEYKCGGEKASGTNGVTTTAATTTTKANMFNIDLSKPANIIGILCLAIGVVLVVKNI